MLDAINELFEKVKSGEIDEDLRMYLLDLLESMRRSIAEYNIRGGAALRRELFAVFETLQRHSALLKEKDKDSGWMKAFLLVVERYDRLAALCTMASPVLERFVQFLQLLG